MKSEFQIKIDKKISEYRDWIREKNFSRCRLVQYCGVDLVGALDVPFNEVESQITGLLCEGYYVDWQVNNDCCYLRVWEFDGPEPEWTKVFAEVPLADVNEILRQAKQSTSTDD